MAETAVSPTPEAPTATPVASPEPAQATGTAKTGSQASGAAPSQDTFLSGDPSTLPPEIRGHYDNMLKDYKKKTEAIAELRKKAETFDRLNQDPRVAGYLQGLSSQQKADFQTQKAEAEVNLGQTISDEEFLAAFQSKETFLKFLEKTATHLNAKSQKEINELKAERQVAKAGDIVQSFATEAGPDGKPLRPDFWALDQEDGLITGYLNVNPPNSEADYSVKLNEAYTWAKSMTQKYYEKGKAEALTVIQKKAGNSTEMPTNSAKNAYTGTDPKKLDAAEAVALAKKGIRIPQNY